MSQTTEYKIVVLLFVVALKSNLMTPTESWPHLGITSLKEKFGVIKTALARNTSPNTDDNLPEIKKGIELMAQFTNINDILEKKVKSDELEQNFAIIPELLKSGYPANDYGYKMVAALQLFNSLNQAQEQCNLEAYTILHKNSNAAVGLPHWKYDQFYGDRRINKIVKQCQINHAEHCGPLYPDQFREQVKELSQERVEFADTLLKNFIKKTDEESASEIMNDSQKLLEFANRDGLANEIIRQPVNGLDELKRLAQGDPDERFLEPVEKIYMGKTIKEMDNDKFESLCQKYLVEPCNDYVNKLKSVFVSAEFDRRVVETQAKPNELQFYSAWAAFKVCDSIVEFKNNFIYNIVEYQNRMAKKVEQSS